MVSEKNAALFFLLYFQYIFGQPPRCFTEHSALAIPSLLETDPQILERWGYADEVHLGKKNEGRILVSNVSMTQHAPVNRTHRIGFSVFELFRKIDEDFGGSIS